MGKGHTQEDPSVGEKEETEQETELSKSNQVEKVVG